MARVRATTRPTITRAFQVAIRWIEDSCAGILSRQGREIPGARRCRGLAKLASRVSGVQAVTDKLEVLPVSSVDDSTRYAIAVRLYSDPLFWNYATQVNPPIHIIVRNGQVTLTGVVISEVDRREAELIARGVFGVFGVENRLGLEKEES